MTVYSNRNDILLHFLPHFKALTIPLSLLCQHRPQYFAHTSATWKTQIQHFSLKVKRAAATVSRICCCSWWNVLRFDVWTVCLAQLWQKKSRRL